MARLARKSSETGIYHIMMRGINHQNIFEDSEDFYQFITTLDRMSKQYDLEGNICGTNCTYYAYCLMSNHFHLLVQERDERIGDTMKRIAASYVYYYNRKYHRDGHLFKERFKSEPVNDMAYFTVLMRYIHQNPVKAGIVRHVSDYQYSSWGEYDGSMEPSLQICNTSIVLRRIPFHELNAFVNDLLPEDTYCLEMEDSSKAGLSDDQVWQLLMDRTNTTNIHSFQDLDNELKRSTLKELKEMGAKVRQLHRLTGISRWIIQNL